MGQTRLPGVAVLAVFIDLLRIEAQYVKSWRVEYASASVDSKSTLAIVSVHDFEVASLSTVPVA